MSAPLFDIPDSRRTWAAYLLFICALAALYFAPVADMGLAEHDAQTFRDNPRISENFSFFFSPEKELVTGRPVAELFKWIASLFLGSDPFGFHLLVVFVHVLAALLLAALLRQMDLDLELSFVSGLLFLINVGHFYAVYHISAMDYPLALGWSFLGVICCLRLCKTNRTLWMIGVYLFLSLGVLSQMAAVAAGPLCLFWSYQVGHDKRKVLRRLIPLNLFLGGLAVFALSITPKSASTWKSLAYHVEDLPDLPLLFGLFRQLFWFTGKLLTTAHGLPSFWHGRQLWELCFGALIVVGLLVLIYRRISPLSVWGVWILCSLLPFLLVDDVTVFGWPEVLSRYLYIASAGSSVCIAWGLQQAFGKLGRRGLGVACLSVLLVFSYAGLRKLDYFFLYRSGYFLWSHGSPNRGIEQVQKAIAGAADLLPLGSIYFRLCNMILSSGGEVDSTLRAARAALPDDDRILAIQRALLSLSPDPSVSLQAQQAIYSTFQQSLTAAPAEHERFRQMMRTIYHSIASRFYARKEWERAVTAYEMSMKFVSPSQKANGYTTRHVLDLTHLGIALAQQGQLDRAIEQFRQALEIRADVTAYYNLGLALKSQGQLEQAVDSYCRALEIQPQNVEILTTLGVAFAQQGQVNRAIEQFRRALEIQPDYVPARQNLSLVRSQ